MWLCLRRFPEIPYLFSHSWTFLILGYSKRRKREEGRRNEGERERERRRKWEVRREK